MRRYNYSAAELESNMTKTRRLIGNCRNVGVYFDRAILVFFETYFLGMRKKGINPTFPLSVLPWSPNVLPSMSAIGTASDRPQAGQQLTRRSEEPDRIVGLEIDAVLLYSILKRD
jgi:hypothetical protein